MQELQEFLATSPTLRTMGSRAQQTSFAHQCDERETQMSPTTGPTMNDAKDEYEVVVIGGGAAGLSGAKILARSRRSMLIIDAGAARNVPAEGVHNYLYAEGTAPSRLTEIRRAEAVSRSSKGRPPRQHRFPIPRPVRCDSTSSSTLRAAARWAAQRCWPVSRKPSLAQYGRTRSTASTSSSSIPKS